MRFLFLFLFLAIAAEAAVPIHFKTDRAGFVSLNLYYPDGSVAARLLHGEKLPAGSHQVQWDGLDLAGNSVASGSYIWQAVIHDGITPKLRGWIGDWGGNRGIPTAAAADDSKVYLGWALSTSDAAAVLACDPTGKVRWSHQRGKSSGCKALAVDADLVYILGGEGDDAQGGAIYRVASKTGALVPWPDGRVDLKVASFWPADGKPKPCLADYLAVKNGRIYLSFVKDEFAAVLDAKSGAYMQTLVGAPPGAIDAVATKSDTPDGAGELVEADFVVTALKGGVIGKLLLVHDPIWVVASDLTPLNRNERITALTMIGDQSEHHRHDIFVGLGFPFNQVQARSALNTEAVSFVAGKPGGRPSQGPWDPETLSIIRALALDSSGKLWVAEGANAPKRISVWSTDSAEGRLAHEFFAPPELGSPVAINPADPDLIYADGCEWRIDPKTGRAKCKGIITQERIASARFAFGQDQWLLLLTSADGKEVHFKRTGDGAYTQVSADSPALSSPEKFRVQAMPGQGTFHLMSGEFDLGNPDLLFQGKISGVLKPPPGNDWPLRAKNIGTPTLTQTADGRYFLTAGTARIWSLELTGLMTLRPLKGGKVSLNP